MKKILFGSVFISLFFVQNALAFGPKSSEPKPKAKTTHTKKESRQWVYLEGDYVLGRLNASLDAVTNIFGPVTDRTVEAKSLRHAFKSGFKVGFGIFFSRFVEFHASWLRMQNNDRLLVTATTANGNSVTGLIAEVATTDGSVCTRFHDRTQTIDALIKSRRFFTYDKVSALPVVGVRSILMDRNARQRVNNQSSLVVTTRFSDVNVRLIGLIVGADLKYTLSRYFNFFGSMYTGAVTGLYKQFIFKDVVFNGTVDSEDSTTYKQAEHFRKFFDATFGLSFNFNIGKAFNVLIRFGAYILYFDSTYFGQMFNNPFATTQATVHGNTFQALTAGGRITF